MLDENIYQAGSLGAPAMLPSKLCILTFCLLRGRSDVIVLFDAWLPFAVRRWILEAVLADATELVQVMYDREKKLHNFAEVPA